MCLLAKGMGKDTVRIYDADGSPMEDKNTVKYLGVWVDRRLKFRTHCQNIATKNSMTKFAEVTKARWGLKGKDLLIYKSIFVPITTYAAGAWAPYAAKRDITKIITAQRSALLVAARGYRTISNPALLIIAGVQHIERELEKEILRNSIRSGTPACIGGLRYDPTTEGEAALKEQLQHKQHEADQQKWP